jgi:hypothetical protein
MNLLEIIAVALGLANVGLLVRRSIFQADPQATLERIEAELRAEEADIEAQIAATQTAAFIATMTPVAAGPCFFNWARQLLPDVTERARQILNEAGLSAIEVRYVEAYGENCLETVGQTVRYFAAMTTDFYLAAGVGELDEEDLGQIFENSYDALLTIPRDSLPAKTGYLDYLFTSGQQEKRLRLMFDQIKAALEAGKHGADLWATMGQ